MSAVWICEIDFPAPLIEAHRSGNLVIFVGAGASMSPPSSLPNFVTLTREIAAEAQVPAEETELQIEGGRLDVFLGQLEDQHVEVHQRVAAHIDKPMSKPNRLHEALADLACAAPVVRVVTTNYDLHISTALRHLNCQPDEYAGPALPTGDDFSGIVYLHGNLRQEPRRLVLTDGDFGRAYLRDAWAARFLERMFAAYTVLFVGYSHSDVVMQYLSRALRPGAARYVLTSSPDDTSWRAYGIHAIGYRVINSSHSSLEIGIQGWASHASMGLLDHRERIRAAVSTPPTPVPEEVSYLENVVADPDLVPQFTEFARGEDWLQWITTQPDFQRLFAPANEPTACTSTLAYWFAQHFVMDQALTTTALGVVRDAGGRLGPTAWSAIGHHLHIMGSPRPGWLDRWIVLLIDNAPDGASDWLEYALVASSWPDSKSVALLLFDHLTEPLARIESAYESPSNARFHIRPRVTSHGIQDAWDRVFGPNLADAAQDILSICDRQLRRACQLAVATGYSDRGWDLASLRRTAIETHSQDQIRGDFDLIIDAARESLEMLLNGNCAFASAHIDAWTTSDVTILQRLALHGWIVRTDVGATAKISWLRAQSWIFESKLRHEVFRLIEMALPLADREVADALVGDAIIGPNESDEESRSYQQFNLLAWITRHAPNLNSAQRAMEEMRARYPQFAEREHPDVISWMKFGTVEHRPPMTTEDLHQLIDTDVANAVAELRGYEEVDSFLNGPTWSDALRVLTETVHDYPSDGFKVLDVSGDNADLVVSVITGWSATAHDDEDADAILQRMTLLDLELAADAVSRLLADGGRGESNPTAWHSRPISRNLASELWSAISAPPVGAPVENWLERAINTVPGRLALFWVQAVAADWTASEDHWTGISAEMQDQLAPILNGHDDRSAMAEVVFASQLFFFFSADHAWCRDHVLPLLSWEDPQRALRTWSGFLSWGRLNDELLKAGLLDEYQHGLSHIGEFPKDLQQQYCLHLARVALYSELEAAPWIRLLTATVEPPIRVEWINQIAWMLKDMPPDAVEHQWNRWMQRYWQDRLNSIPRQLTHGESSAMASWIVPLTNSMGQGVALATAYAAGINEHDGILHELDGEPISRAPAECAKLIAHLLRGTQQPFWGCHYLKQILPKIRGTADANDLQDIVQEALRLGCQNAPEWLNHTP
ncbi:DUF4020 domain-containing protein [Nocardia fluminea]